MNRMPRVTAAFLLALLALLTTAGPAAAHRYDESYLYLDVGDSTLSGRVELPYADVRTVFDLSLSGSVDDINAEIEANLEMLQDYVEAESAVGADGAVWNLTFDGYGLLEEEGVGVNGRGYVILPFTVDLPFDTVPQVVEVTFTPFLDEIPGRNNIVLVSNDWKRGVVEEEANELLIVDAETPGGSIDFGEPDQWRNFRSSIDLGIDHIKTGPDHIFFILVLLLTSVLVLQAATWQPSPSFTYSLGRLVLVATMFTIAHSITFTLAGLDLIPLPPSKLVETLIALSIGAAALHNLRPVLGHREWALAFGFGLFHGMGFAGLVQELDIGRGTQLVSLLGRNLGIEIGQLVIIAIAFPGLYLLRQTRFYRPILVLSSLTLAALSFVWVVERVFEVDAGINDIILKVVKWPRSFWLAVLFTVLAAAIREIERRRDALLPVGTPEGSDDAEVPSDDVAQHVGGA